MNAAARVIRLFGSFVPPFQVSSAGRALRAFCLALGALDGAVNVFRRFARRPFKSPLRLNPPLHAYIQTAKIAPPPVRA